jgi:hypothetical protein
MPMKNVSLIFLFASTVIFLIFVYHFENESNYLITFVSLIVTLAFFRVSVVSWTAKN